MKGHVTKYTNNCTTAVFPHENKILLRIIQQQLESDTGHETPMEQTSSRKKHGTREQIANVSESWTAHRSTTKRSMYFIDYTKVFIACSI
jgi:hypothetical protein